MFRQDWRRFIPAGSQLLLLAALVVLVVAAIGFVGLFTLKNEALSDRAIAQTQRDMLLQQQQRLTDALAAGQRKENIEPDARKYFKMGLPGENEIVGQPAPVTAPEKDLPAGGPPYWKQWWQKLTQP